jgi:A/G-specific adenine glycosylase
LLSLPEVHGHVGIEAAHDGGMALAAHVQTLGKVDEVQALLPLVHVFTHYKLHIHPHKVTLNERAATPASHVWVKMDDVADAALPAPIKKLLLELARPSLF